MSSFGWYLIIAGIGSGLLSAFDYEFSLLIWIDTWGSGFAWLIRGALILIGMGLVQREMNRRQQPKQPEPAQHDLIS